MDLIQDRCAGLDVHKKTVVACAFVPGPDGTPQRFLRTFRKTVATRLDEAGFTPRQVADQLGHANPSMTLDVYFGRQVVSAEAARVLGR